ncbi:MAG: hypothetical protein KBF88_13175, partial [Polyangiaceae bacterium]|nr:hypothetical protein [Polyangiaceae bacterium]
LEHSRMQVPQAAPPAGTYASNAPPPVQPGMPQHAHQGQLAGQGLAGALMHTAQAHSAQPIHAQPTPTHGVKVRILAPIEAIQASLQGMPNVVRVDLVPTGKFSAGTTALVTYVGDETVLATIVRHLAHANIPVVGVEPERNELERIFLEVTKGDLQ